MPIETISSLLHCWTFFSCYAHPRPRNPITIYIVALRHQARPAPTKTNLKTLSLLNHISGTAYSILANKTVLKRSLQALSIGLLRFFQACFVRKLFGIERLDSFWLQILVGSLSQILFGSLSLASIWKQDFKLNLNNILNTSTLCVIIHFVHSSLANLQRPSRRAEVLNQPPIRALIQRSLLI